MARTKRYRAISAINRKGQYHVYAILASKLGNSGRLFKIWWRSSPLPSKQQALENGLISWEPEVNLYCPDLLEVFKEDQSEEWNLKTQTKKFPISHAGKRITRSVSTTKSSVKDVTSYNDFLGMVRKWRPTITEFFFYSNVLSVYSEFVKSKRTRDSGCFVNLGTDIDFIVKVNSRWELNRPYNVAYLFPHLLGKTVSQRQAKAELNHQLRIYGLDIPFPFCPKPVGSVKRLIYQYFKKDGKPLLIIRGGLTGLKNSYVKLHAGLIIVTTSHEKVHTVYYWDPFAKDMDNSKPPADVVSLRKHINWNGRVWQGFGMRISGGTCLVDTLKLAGLIMGGFPWLQMIEFVENKLSG